MFSPFQAILNTFHIFRKNKKIDPPGGSGGPPTFVYPKSYFYCDLKPHGKFQNPTITPSGRKVTGAEREKIKNAINSEHLVP